MRLLLVDDESNIRLTLATILRGEGFDVTTAASVPEAINSINNQAFDALISDLNIGEPGDGFTVVSVMRRVQPDAVTLILTGYPDFESAIQAVRNQVDDYLTKPADIPSLVANIKHKLQNRQARHQIVVRRAPELILENLSKLLKDWTASVSQDAQLKHLPMSPVERIGNYPEILAGACTLAMKGSSTLDGVTATYATQHSIARLNRGYRADLILTESRLLQRQIGLLLQEHLLAIDLSTLILDVMNIADLITLATEESIRSFNAQSEAA